MDGLDLSLRTSRVFPAPREAVFRAWTDPEQLKRWWGPRGYTTPSAEIDLRVGGAYVITMRAPDGERILLRGTYREVQRPERLVYTWLFERTAGQPTSPEETVVAVDFVEVGGGTEVIITHQRFTTEQARASHEGGWRGCFDCLAELLSA